MKKAYYILGTAIVLGIFFLSSALNQAQPKFGVVDLSRIANDSKYGKKKQEELKAQNRKYEDVLNFIRQYPFLSKTEVTKLRDLMLADKLTPEQQTELDALKASGQRLREEFDKLVTLQNPSEAEQKRLQQLVIAREENARLGSQWENTFRMNWNEMFENVRNDVYAKIRQAVNKLGKRDGYTIIFESNTAPYAANDVTDATLKIMDQDNP
ncbi:MAG TPA: OmpH family outer membrane protein [Fimbriimonadales bacterium]|nr:OmpH family outer membrane protein [Fimbriimonadales bacterium]